MHRSMSFTVFTLLLLWLVHPSSEKAYSKAERRQLIDEIQRDLERYEFVKSENKEDDKKEDNSEENTKVLDDEGYGTGGAIELRDKNLLYLEFPGNEVLSFYDIKDVLDQYDCTGYKRD
uniref:Uncharacterized protein n=1 Tax=Magallana gigas TaxID=29159 RepID=K1PT75_MAGGI